MKTQNNYQTPEEKSYSSEAFAANLLSCEFKKAFEHVFTIQGAIFKPNDGLMPSSAEADTIIICEGGIFVFEVKSWDGFIHQEQSTFFVTQPGKPAKHRDNPIHQNTRKCRYLKALVPGINVQNRVLITGENAVLDYKLPPLLMTRQDIPHCVRTDSYLARHKLNLIPPDEVKRIYQVIAGAISEANVTKEEHIANCQFHHKGELALQAA